MKKYIIICFLVPFMCLMIGCDRNDDDVVLEIDSSFNITSTGGVYNSELDQVELWMELDGIAGQNTPVPVGQLDGAIVFGYVFPTTLKTKAVGFGDTGGILALALTSHPDFDDTPLWDEDADGDYSNDGIVWHAHWVILVETMETEGGLAVKEFDPMDNDVVLPPTNPGMPMYMDSPGFPVVLNGRRITVVIPAQRINFESDFRFDAVTCRMQVNTSNPNKPLLGVYEIFEIFSEDLSLPFDVE